MRLLVDPAIADRFPGLAPAFAVVEDVQVGPSAAAAPLAREAEARVRATRTLERVKDEPVFRAYRDFYWAIGIDPTKTRPASEALNRRVLRPGELPSINSFVDAYNAASLETGVSIGAYDLALVEGDVTLRPARAGEPFRGIGEPHERALAGGEPVLADAHRLLTFYPYRDADATKVTAATRRALLVACGVPALAPEQVLGAARRAAELVVAACGGRIAGEGAADLP